MKKRIMTGLLACCLSLSLALPGFAAGSIPAQEEVAQGGDCLLYTSPSPRDRTRSRMPSSA